MAVLNDLDRSHLATDVIDRVPKLGYRAAHLRQAMRDKLIEHREYIGRHGQDMPEILEWRWRIEKQALEADFIGQPGNVAVE